MAILIMGKYAISKLSIILYHIVMDLSTDFGKLFKKFFGVLAGEVNSPRSVMERGSFIYTFASQSWLLFDLKLGIDHLFIKITRTSEIHYFFSDTVLTGR